MNAEITADTLIPGGLLVPRGTYLCLSTGLVHRLSRPASLPESGPFRMVAPTCTLTVSEPPVTKTSAAARTPAAPLGLDQWSRPAYALRWPEDECRPLPEDQPDPARGWWQVMLLARLGRIGTWY